MLYINELLELGSAERIMKESPARFFHLLENIAEGIVQETPLEKGACWSDNNCQMRAAALSHGFVAYARWLRSQIKEFGTHHV